MTIDTADLLDRFTRYVQIDTRSDPHSDSTPTTPGQWDLLRLLADELRALGVADVSIDEWGYVLGTLPATSDKAGVPRVAWFAHVDTAPNLPSAAQPIVHRAYDGRPIVLPDDPTQRLDVDSTPHLRECIGHDIITASGTTLLGADDKAGVSVVMAAARHLLRHPEIPHGEIRVCFNPDEEVAAGVLKLDLSKVNADAAYTLDGDLPGGIDHETFSADNATLEIRGIAAHPGWAKGVMVNALRLAGRFLAALPSELSPERTDGRDGFIHPGECTGSAEKAVVRLILRDFELDGLAEKRALLGEDRSRVARRRAARGGVAHFQGAIPQHALLAGQRSAPRGIRARSPAPGGLCAALEGDPRRHRWIESHRAGPAHAESFLRHARGAFRAGVGLAPRHDQVRRDVATPRAGVGRTGVVRGLAHWTAAAPAPWCAAALNRRRFPTKRKLRTPPPFETHP